MVIPINKNKASKIGRINNLWKPQGKVWFRHNDDSALGKKRWFMKRTEEERRERYAEVREAGYAPEVANRLRSWRPGAIKKYMENVSPDSATAMRESRPEQYHHHWKDKGKMSEEQREKLSKRMKERYEDEKEVD